MDDFTMSPNRARRWIGLHPLRFMSLATALSLLAYVLCFIAESLWLADTVIVDDWPRRISIYVHEWRPLIVTYVIPGLLIAAAALVAAITTVIMAKAGLRTRRVLMSIAWDLPIAAVAGLVFVVLRGFTHGVPSWEEFLVLHFFESVVRFLTWCLSLWFCLAAGHLIGWAGAHLVSRYKMRRGKWEFTEPVSRSHPKTLRRRMMTQPSLTIARKL